MSDAPRDRPPPIWLPLLAGWMVASSELARTPETPSESEERSRAPFGALDRPEADPDRMSPRELRLLPGIGPARALAIARARWDLGLSGGPASWERLWGIGPGTVAGVERYLESAPPRSTQGR